MIGYWPGSAVHQRATLAHPRFEDFDYESHETDETDSLAWMGNGMIMAQELNTSTTGYLDTVDKPPVAVSSQPEENAWNGRETGNCGDGSVCTSNCC